MTKVYGSLKSNHLSELSVVVFRISFQRSQYRLNLTLVLLGVVMVSVVDVLIICVNFYLFIFVLA